MYKVVLINLELILNQHSPDILCVSETWLKSQESLSDQFTDYNSLGGVCIFEIYPCFLHSKSKTITFLSVHRSPLGTIETFFNSCSNN